MKAIWSPHTGIIDFQLVNQNYAKDFQNMGGVIHTDFKVKEFIMASESKTADVSRYPVIVKGNHGVSSVFKLYFGMDFGLRPFIFFSHSVEICTVSLHLDMWRSVFR